MSTPVCRLGGVLVTADAAVPWAVTTGVAPFVTTVFVHEKEWPKVEAMLGNETTLTVTRDGKSVATIHGVYPLRLVPSNKPFMRGLLIADRRWKWDRELVVRDFNVTRRSGDKALLGPTPTNVPIELAQSVDRYRFLKQTLDGGVTRFTARKVLESVLERVDPGNWAIVSLSIQNDNKTGALSIQNLLLRDTGATAIARALSDMPGTMIRVDEDGVARVFDATDVEAVPAVLGPAGKPTVLGEIARKIDYRALRPRYVDVYFAREAEFRFDFDEGTERRYSFESGDLYCDNVLPLPDPVTTMTDGRRLSMGTWVTVREALDAWEASRTGHETMPYSFATLRLHYALGDLPLVWGGAPDAPTDVSADHNAHARAMVAMQHYRQTFRINREYADRLRDLRNVRVAILDTTTGARVPALTWSQYCIITSRKAQVLLAQRSGGGVDQVEWVNADKYPGLNAELDGANVAPSQASVSIVDGDLGIVRLSYVPSPFGTMQSVLPALVGDENGTIVAPVRDLTKQDTDLISVGGRVGVAGRTISLSSTYKMALVISGQVASPNNERQCHRQRVRPGDFADNLRSRFTAATANGPPASVFVPPQQSTARFGWHTTQAARESARKMLGVDQPDPTKAGLDPGTTTIPGYLWVNEKEVTEMAKGAAAEVYAAYVDAIEGRHVTSQRDVAMVGNIERVERGLASDGRLTTTVALSSSRPTVSRFAYLSDATRQIVLRIIGT